MPATSHTKTLPEKPSELIRVALADLIKAEKTKGYKIDMNGWIEGNPAEEGQPCTVCLAGAVMAFSLDFFHEKDVTPGMTTSGNGAQGLYALNSFRLGLIRDGLDEMKVRLSVINVWVDQYGSQERAPAYEPPRKKAENKKFKDYLTDLADRLEAYGI